MKFLKKNTIEPWRYTKRVELYVGISNYQGFEDTRFGLEIEVEGMGCVSRAQNLTTSPYWGIDSDGSLRGECVELISCAVLKDDLPHALTSLQKEFGDFPDENMSERTSVHVHYNVTKWTVAEMHKALTCAYLFEALMVRRSGGAHREGNHFCLRSFEAPTVIEMLVDFLRDPNQGAVWFDVGRYLNINPQAFSKFGTIEFRSHRGCTDANEIYRWCLVIDEVMTTALKFESPAEIMRKYSEYGLEEFVFEFFPMLFHYLNGDLSHPDNYECHKNAQRVAYAVRVAEGEQSPKKTLYNHQGVTTNG